MKIFENHTRLSKTLILGPIILSLPFFAYWGYERFCPESSLNSDSLIAPYSYNKVDTYCDFIDYSQFKMKEAVHQYELNNNHKDRMTPSLLEQNNKDLSEKYSRYLNSYNKYMGIYQNVRLASLFKSGLNTEMMDLEMRTDKSCSPHYFFMNYRDVVDTYSEHPLYQEGNHKYTASHETDKGFPKFQKAMGEIR